MKKSKFSKSFNKNDEIMYVFRDVPVTVLTTFEDEKDDIAVKNIVEALSKEIYIDKSYVDFDGNKHQDAFIEETGWNKLKKLLIDTDFGANTSASEDEFMLGAFQIIITAYLLEILDHYGYDPAEIEIDFKHGKRLHSEFHIDEIREWETYPGPWQDWQYE